MGQTNSKEETGTVGGESRSIYPIGGGHVGEGPIFNNPVAESSQMTSEKPMAAQEASPVIQPQPGSVPGEKSTKEHRPSKFSSGECRPAFMNRRYA